jgi:hypothetical protein
MTCNGAQRLATVAYLIVLAVPFLFEGAVMCGNCVARCCQLDASHLLCFGLAL